MQRHKILFVSPEIRPFAWAGGLGEVSASLPKHMDSCKFDMRTIMPLYASMNEEYRRNLEKLIDFDINITLLYLLKI